MKLYHGTTTENFQKIRKEGLKINMPSNYDGDVETSKGFLYFSDNIAIAAYYGHLISLRKAEKQYVILEVDVPPPLLSIDEDELKFTLEDFGVNIDHIKSVEECLDICGSIRISQDLGMGDIKRVLFLDVNKPNIDDGGQKSTRHVTEKFVGELRKYHPRAIEKNKENQKEAENISSELEWKLF